MIRYHPWLALASLLCVFASACSRGGGREKASQVALIGFSAGNLADPVEARFQQELKAVVDTKRKFTLQTRDAGGDATRQETDIAGLIAEGAALLLVHPVKPESLAPALAERFKASVPIVVIGRPLAGEEFTCFIRAAEGDLSPRDVVSTIKKILKKKPVEKNILIHPPKTGEEIGSPGADEPDREE